MAVPFTIRPKNMSIITVIMTVVTFSAMIVTLMAAVIMVCATRTIHMWRLRGRRVRAAPPWCHAGRNLKAEPPDRILNLSRTGGFGR